MRRYGLDDYSRYREIDGERYAVEPFPFWGWSPAYLWYHALARFGVCVWHLSHLTGIQWQDEL